MGHKIESGEHPVVERKCANPQCETVFNVQTGGQKAGSSPAVHVEQVGQTPKGYCSTRCLFNCKGWDLQPLIDLYKKMGIDYDELFPPGYLPPACRINPKKEAEETNLESLFRIDRQKVKEVIEK